MLRQQIASFTPHLMDEGEAGQERWPASDHVPTGSDSRRQRAQSAVWIVVRNYSNLDNCSFTPETGDFNRSPGWVRLAQVFEANPVEHVKVITQADMVGGHFNNRSKRQTTGAQDEPDFFKYVSDLSFRVSRHLPVCVTTCGTCQENVITGHNRRRHFQLIRRQTKFGWNDYALGH